MVLRERAYEGLAEKHRAVVDGAAPMTNRSAREEVRSSLHHYGGEGVLVRSSYRGVCGRDGAEGSCLTSGDLGGSRVAPGKRPYKREQNGKRDSSESRTAE